MAKKKPKTTMPICKVMCATCPFREGSKYEFLKPMLTASAMTEASRKCHSTDNDGLGGRTGKPPKICRGARNVQLNLFYRIGFIKAPTDEAWADRCKALGLPVPKVC